MTPLTLDRVTRYENAISFGKVRCASTPHNSHSGKISELPAGGMSGEGRRRSILYEHPTLQRLEDQIGWYDRKSHTAQRRYKVLKLVQVSIAALIPLAATLPIPPPEFKWVTAILGLVVLVIEALQQLNQDQQNWIAYRSTCESLKHEKYLFLAGAGPYTNAENKDKRLVLLGDRIEGLISQEHAKWVSTQEQAATKNTAAGRNSTQAEQGRQHSGG